MKRFLSTKYSASAFNVALLVLRVGTSIFMAKYGYNKIVNFEEYSAQFINFLGLGSNISLGLAIFAEFFCAILVILGLFTRLATIPIIITMMVATKADNFDFFGKAEHPLTFLLIYFAILLVGPGKISVDGAVNK